VSSVEDRLPKIPSVEDYRRAIRSMEIARVLTDTRWKLLRTHCIAPGRMLTTLELANAMGWATHGGVNLHYGELAAELGRRMSWAAAAGEPQSALVARFEGGGGEDPHTRWIMHDELARALVLARIAPPPRD
jgi:hypothetical protein